MSLDAIDLITKDGGHFLVDVNTCKPVALSRTAWQVLRELKDGRPLAAVRESLGEGTVAAVLGQLRELQESGALSGQRRDFRKEARETLERLPEEGISALEGVFMVTQGCNLACRYCYGGESGTFGRSGRMSEETAELCLRCFLSIAGRSRLQKVVFLGGEPLMNLRAVRRVVELWEEWRPQYPDRELYFSTTTNGTLLTKETVRFLKDKQIGVTVSIDGPRETHDANRPLRGGRGSWDRVMAGIGLLREQEVPFSVRATLTRQTDMRELHRFFADNDFRIEYLIPVDFPRLERQADYQLDLEDFRRLTGLQQELMREGLRDVETGDVGSFRARQLSMAFHGLRAYRSSFPFKCGAGWWIFAFDIDGRIYPCQRFVGHDAHLLGDAGRGIDMERVTAMYRRFLEASEGCDSCWAVHLCRRRCFFQKAKEDGTFEPIPEAVCDVYRDSYAASMTFAGELQAYAREHRTDSLDDVLTRYDTERLTREHREKGGHAG